MIKKRILEDVVIESGDMRASAHVSSIQDALNFVKMRKNIFNDKTMYKVQTYFLADGTFYVVKEFNYHQGERNVWLWIFRKDSHKFYTVEDYKGKPTVYEIVRAVSAPFLWEEGEDD